LLCAALLATVAAPSRIHAHAQSADWQEVVWREPQVRYLLADMTLGGKTRLYRDSDLPYPETNVRYFLADMHLGGSRGFYHRTAEAAHEMGCQEAVARFDAGVQITNLGQFERKQVGGKVLITSKGSNERISGMLVKLSTDLE